MCEGGVGGIKGFYLTSHQRKLATTKKKKTRCEAEILRKVSEVEVIFNRYMMTKRKVIERMLFALLYNFCTTSDINISNI